jgi:hypothetical protein
MNIHDQRLSDLAEGLETSISAVQGGGRFVASWQLPAESELVTVHAQLARGVRSQRRLRAVAVLPMPELP